MKLHLGVIDFPYVSQSGEKKSGKIVVETTGDVAEILEGKYHIMEHFFELHGDDIAAALEDGLAGALETLLLGGSPATDLFASGAAKIEEIFRRFLESRELETLGYPGIPTQSALLGISHRFKKKRGPRRPSFIDTGAYEGAFKIWLDA